MRRPRPSRSHALKHLPPEVVRAGSLFSDGELSAAENILRAYLLKAGDHVEAMRLLARIEHQRDVLDEAEMLLEAALKLAPNYLAARLDYVRVLIDRQKYLRAREEIDTLLRLEPGNSDYLSLYAAACVGLGEHEPAIALYRQLLAAAPASAELHVSLGHSLRPSGGRRRPSNPTVRRRPPDRASAMPTGASPISRPIAFRLSEIAHMRAEEAAPGAAPRRSLPSVLRARQGVRGPGRIRGILAILRARQRTQARRKPLPSGHHRN